MRVSEQLSRDTRIEFDSEIPRLAFYYQGDEIDSMAVNPTMSKLENFLRVSKEILDKKDATQMIDQMKIQR